MCSRMIISSNEQMSTLEELWAQKKDYRAFKLSKNPFSIVPLFQDYLDIERCKEAMPLFVVTKEITNAMRTFDLGRRILIWGEIGVGKTSLLNMLLYYAYLEKKCLPIRITLAESNIERTVQEILYNFCFELIEELKRKTISKPLNAVRKWILDKRFADKLYDFMYRLAATAFEEEKTKETKRKIGGDVKVGMGLISGGLDAGGEVSTTKSFKTYVENLPAIVIKNHLETISELVTALGYEGVVFAIDEADHIPDARKVINALTVSREIFFTSENYTFVLCGSPEMIKGDIRREITGIFDSDVQVKQLDDAVIRNIFSKRVEAASTEANVSLNDVFDEQAISTILINSNGKLKFAFKIAQNALDEAAYKGKTRVDVKDVESALSRMHASIEVSLEPSEQKVLDALNKLGAMSASDSQLQTETGLSRQSLDRILKVIHQKGLLTSTKKGKKVIYNVLSPA
jgi:uncharacterized membrane protein